MASNKPTASTGSIEADLSAIAEYLRSLSPTGTLPPAERTLQTAPKPYRVTRTNPTQTRRTA